MMLSPILLSLPGGERIRIARTKVEADEDPLGVGQVTDDLADRRRQFPHESWNGQNLIALRELRIFHQINDFDAVAAGEMLFAELLEIAKGGDRFEGRPGDVEPQIPIHGHCCGCFAFGGDGGCFHGCPPLVPFRRGRLPLLLTASCWRLRPISTLSEASDASRCLSWL